MIKFDSAEPIAPPGPTMTTVRVTAMSDDLDGALWLLTEEDLEYMGPLEIEECTVEVEVEVETLARWRATQDAFSQMQDELHRLPWKQ